jgi:hypothetical protein
MVKPKTVMTVGNLVNNKEIVGNKAIINVYEHKLILLIIIN